MAYIIKFLSIILFLHCSIVVFTELRENCSTVEANRIVIDTWKAFFASLEKKRKQVPVQYPVWIGIDEYGYAQPEIIEEKFSSVAENFQTFYLYDFKSDEMFLYYAFKCSNPKIQLEKSEFITYMNKLCEEIIHKYIRFFNKNWKPIGHIVCTNYKDNILYVLIAKNSASIDKIAERKHKLRAHYKEEEAKAQSTSQNSKIIEKVGDDDNLGV